MSSVVISTSAALSRPFLFDAESELDVCLSAEPKKPAQGQVSPEVVLASVAQSKIGNRQLAIPLSPASRLAIRPTPDMASTGIPALDALTGGLPRGCLTELCGTASSGRTTVLLAALAAATRRGEFCALIDASDSLDPHSAIAAGVDPGRLLWVRCGDDAPKKNSSRRHGGTEKTENIEKQIGKPSTRVGCPILVPRIVRDRMETSTQPSKYSDTKSSQHRLEQVLRATDLLLESGGFGLILLDLADIPLHWARRIPMTTWFRFRRAVEHKSTALLAIAQQPVTGSCSSLSLRLGVPSAQYSVPSSQNDGFKALRAPLAAENCSHTELLTQLQIRVESIRSRLDRKPSHSITFESKTAWAG